MSKLTERQLKLIDLICSGTRWREALDLLGYADSTSKSDILKSSDFREELASRVEGMLAFNGVSAVRSLEDAMDNPHQAGAGIKVKAATEFLDRMGLAKVERTKHEGDPTTGVFVLPPKEEKS